MVLTAFTVAPAETGQGFLLLRATPLDGLLALLGVVSNRIGPSLIGAGIGALLLVALDRTGSAPGRLTLDAAFDACCFALVPFLLLASAGAALSSRGLELWFLPHRALRGRADVLAIRAAVAYGWPMALYVVAARDVWRGRGVSQP